MISTQSLATYIQSVLNANDLGVVFEITGDMGRYSKLKSNVEGWKVAGVCSVLSGTFEPIPNIKAYTTSIAIEVFAFASPEAVFKGGPRYENIKTVVENAVQSLNGNSIPLDGSTAIFQGGTITVAGVTQQGGGYERLPILMDFMLTVADIGEMTNKYPVEIDGESIIYTDFSINMQKTGDSGAPINSKILKTRYNTTALGFSVKVFVFLDDFTNKILDDILGAENGERELNTEYSLTYMNRTNKVNLQSGAILAQIGSLIVVNLAFSMVGFSYYTVTFDGNEGTTPQPISAEEGQVIILPATTKGEYGFLGWYLGDEKIGDTGDEYTVTGNITLTARWGDNLLFTINVTFNSTHYKQTTLTPMEIWEGQTATLYFDEKTAESGTDLSIVPNTGNYSVTTSIIEGKQRYTWQGVIYENVTVTVNEVYGGV